MNLIRGPLADPEPLIRRVYAYVAYRIGDGVEAEDVTSATFERAVRYKHSYDASRGEPIGWLIGIAQRVIAARGASVEILMPDVPARAQAQSVAEDAMLHSAVQSAMGVLKKRDRELIALRYGADMQVKEIARLLKLRPNTVEVALHRARVRLAEILEVGEAEHRTSTEDRVSDPPAARR
jgi:RNA polymerase sigma factor (sigma-70 family)